MKKNHFIDLFSGAIQTGNEWQYWRSVNYFIEYAADRLIQLIINILDGINLNRAKKLTSVKMVFIWHMTPRNTRDCQ